MDASILIISYNTRALTLACLRSVFAQTRGVGFEVIVWDNASADGSADAIAEEFPQVHLIRSKDNVGFAAANNRAARAARGEYLLLLNSDTVLLDDAVATIVAYVRSHSEIGIAGGRTFFADGRLNHNSCHGAPTLWSLLCQGAGLSSVFRRSRLFDPESLGTWPRDSARHVDAVTGCFLLVRRRLWEELGGFDESFFMYGEDTDLCLRARAAGWACGVCPQARLIHHGAASDRVRPEKMIKLLRAKAQLLHKHWHPWTASAGAALLACWPLTRWLAFCAAGGLSDRFESSRRTWSEVWRRRAEFRFG